MNIEKTNAQMKKGVLEMCILSIVSHKAAYASDILTKLKEARLIVVEGTMYPLLTRLKNEGFMTYYWEESRSGPPRKYYEITELGRSFFKELMKSWKELTTSVNAIIKSSKQLTVDS